MNINEGNIDCTIYISSTTRISPLEDQNFPLGGNFPPVGNHCSTRTCRVQWYYVSYCSFGEYGKHMLRFHSGLCQCAIFL